MVGLEGRELVGLKWEIDMACRSHNLANVLRGRGIFTIFEDGEECSLSGQACFETVPDGKQVRE